MKRFAGIIIVFTVFFAGCNIDDEVVTFEEQLEIDLAIIDTYLAENGITAQVDSASQIRYVIEEPGTGARPDNSSEVTVNYKGYFLDEAMTVFDENENITFPLSRVIIGWQIGIPFFQEGGSGTLYIPSGYAYGPSGSPPNIDPNTVLAFDVDLLVVR